MRIIKVSIVSVAIRHGMSIRIANVVSVNINEKMDQRDSKKTLFA